MTEAPAAEQPVHASCVALDGVGVLLLGDSGAGKSDLALRLMGAGWRLVADDWTDLRPGVDGPVASAPPRLRGLIEVRGIGIVRVAALSEARVAAAVELVSPENQPRLPDPARWRWASVDLPLWRLDPFAGAAMDKLRLVAEIASGAVIVENDP